MVNPPSAAWVSRRHPLRRALLALLRRERREVRRGLVDLRHQLLSNPA